jgi:hypothetical protein
MYSENKKWFSQTLLYYEDHKYQTEGKLRIAISTNTSDGLNFNPPQFNISISHNYQKSCNLQIQQAMDLFDAIKEALKQVETSTSPIEILRRITKNVELSIIFKKDLNDMEVVEISLRSNSTDFTKIIITTDIFSAFAHRLKNFVNNYDNLCYQLLMKSIDGENVNILQQLPGLIRGISSQIIPSKIPDAGATVPEQAEPVASQPTIEEFDKFLGNDLENVKVPELESHQIKEEKSSVYEVKSDFVEIVLQNRLLNLENILTSVDGSKMPVSDLNQEFKSIIGKEVSYLPGLEGDELKSTYYLSKLLCSIITQAHIKFNSAIPTSTPILKYKVKDYKDENLELAYDLLLFFAYVRTLRNRMSDKTNDFIINKSRFYLQMRCYLDVFCFSFIEKTNKDQLRSIILNRYKHYEKIGVFDDYKTILQTHNCPQIKEYDIDSFISEACEKVIGKTMYITEQHDTLVSTNSFRIPSSNNFTLEQITNEVVPLEVEEKMGVELKNANVTNISPEVVNWFMGKQPKVKKETKEKTSNIVRFITHFRNEIPEQYRDDFIDWIKAVENMNFSFDDSEYPLAEFGGNIIKGLYLWKPDDDEKLAKNYKYFWSKYEDCILSKSDIFALGEKVDDKKADDWSSAFDGISFE